MGREYLILLGRGSLSGGQRGYALEPAGLALKGALTVLGPKLSQKTYLFVQVFRESLTLIRPPVSMAWPFPEGSYGAE